MLRLNKQKAVSYVSVNKYDIAFPKTAWEKMGSPYYVNLYQSESTLIIRATEDVDGIKVEKNRCNKVRIKIPRYLTPLVVHGTHREIHVRNGSLEIGGAWKWGQ